MKKTIIIFFSVILVILVVLFITRTYISNSVVEWNNDEFGIVETVEMPSTQYNGVSGSWWGHNQYKLASLESTLFFIEYDNSALDNGNSSIDNPFTCRLKYLLDSTKVSIDDVPCNSPGIVLTDEGNHKVYFVIVEPTGPAATGGYGWTGESTTFVYEYDFNVLEHEALLVEKHIVTPSVSDGKIRQGATIDGSGNLAIAYGTYEGYIELYTFEYQTRVWSNNRVLSNEDNDSLMYCNVQMLDIENVYVLCQQDTAKDGHVYYQYVKFFAYKNGIWDEKMIADYREHSLAQIEDTLVINSDLYVIDNQVHIITTAQNFYEILHVVYEDDEYTYLETDRLPETTRNIKLVTIEDELYYIVFLSKYTVNAIDIYQVDSLNIVFSVTGVSNNHYFYPYVTKEDTLYILLYSNENEPGHLYKLKVE